MSTTTSSADYGRFDELAEDPAILLVRWLQWGTVTR